MDEKKEKSTRGLQKGSTEELFGNLGSLISNFAELAKATEKGQTKSGEFGPGARIKYQYSVRTLEEEIPRVSVPPRPRSGSRPQTSFGKGLRTIDRPIRPRTIGLATAPESKWARKDVLKGAPGEQESLIDVFDEEDHVLVVARLPEIKEEDLKSEIVGNTLTITATTPQGEVRKEISIPRRSGVDRIKELSFRHGVLQIKLGKVGRA